MLKAFLSGIAIVLAPVPAIANLPDRNSYIVLNYHDIPEHGSKVGPFDRMSVAKQNFVGHLDWLAANGYHFVSIQQIIDAHAGREELPDKAVLLTFDDGFESFYTRVFPILRERQIPAVEAVIGTWMRRSEKPDVPGIKPVLTWSQVREIEASGLVEIASHTDAMHDEINADPEGETHAAVTTRAYLDAAGRYETDREYSQRLAKGMARSAAFVTAATGHPPRVLVWPYGEYNALAVAAASRAGMPITLALSDGVNDAHASLSVIKRLLVTDDPEVPAFAAMVMSLRADRAQHAISVDLGALLSADPAAEARNEAAVIRRVKASGASAVYLQAYADRGGMATGVYFPNRHLPMEADLLGAMTERVKEETGAKVYALMPARVTVRTPAASRWASDIYEDLAKYVAIDGLVLSRDSLRYPYAKPDAGGLSLADASGALTARMRTFRPFIKTAVDVDALPRQRSRFAPALGTAIRRYLRRYDFVIVDAPSGNQAPRQLARMVENVEHGVGNIDRIIFGLAVPHVRSQPKAGPRLLRADLAAVMRSGARNIELQTGTRGFAAARVNGLFGATVAE